MGRRAFRIRYAHLRHFQVYDLAGDLEDCIKAAITKIAICGRIEFQLRWVGRELGNQEVARDVHAPVLDSPEKGVRQLCTLA